MADENRDQRVPVLFTASELQRLDDWMFARRIRSRGEAIRRLLELGYRADEGETGEKGKAKANG